MSPSAHRAPGGMFRTLLVCVAVALWLACAVGVWFVASWPGLVADLVFTVVARAVIYRTRPTLAPKHLSPLPRGEEDSLGQALAEVEAQARAVRDANRHVITTPLPPRDDAEDDTATPAPIVAPLPPIP